MRNSKALCCSIVVTLFGGSVFAYAENGVRKVGLSENGQAAGPEWYCNAGHCRGDDGKIYRCGYVLCGGQVTECGCTCLSVSNAPYPKGFCGNENPYPTSDAAANVLRRTGPFPFSLN